MPVVHSSRGASESASVRQRRIRRLLAHLQQAIPVPRVELEHGSPLQLLVATILSAQATDQRVNQVTPTLFQRYARAADYATAAPSELEALIRSTGFFKSKARSLIGCGKALVERFGGEVPTTMNELISLPGVGRKTANVILASCFGKPAVIVDTHVKRVAQRLGLTRSDEADLIEQDLQRLIPREDWASASQRLLLHGRYTCVARRPRCDRCPIYSECVWKGKLPR